MADPRATPTVPTTQVTTLDVGPTPTIPATAATPPIPETPPGPGQPDQAARIGLVSPGAGRTRDQGDPTDPVNGIGIEGEATVWEARYSIKNFIGRIATRTLLSIAWIVLAVYVWGYDHDNLRIPAVIAGIAVVVLWVMLIFRILQTRFGHYYRLTTRRLFISTGVLTRERDQLELLRVHDVFTRQQTLMDRWLGVGTVVITPADKSLPTLHILGVDDPKGVMDLVWHHARAEQDQRNVKVEQV